MFDVVGVGANSVDIVYRLPGRSKMPIDVYTEYFGGQVTTALATCSALGLRGSYIGTFGNDRRATRMRDELTRLGIDITHAVVCETANPMAVVIIGGGGERIVLWSRDKDVALHPGHLHADTIRSARLVHVDDVDVEASAMAADIARGAGLPVTSDIEKPGFSAHRLLSIVTVPIMAEDVPIAMSGETRMDRALLALRRPHHTMLCVTLGAQGAMLLEGDTLHHEPGLPVKAVDTTGAGDVFRGAFIYALLRGDSPRDILRFANAAAAVSCTKLGAMAGAPTLAEIEALRPS